MATTKEVQEAPLTGPELRELRRRKGWSQEKLAREIPITSRRVSAWENGEAAISPAMSNLIRRILA